MKATFYPAKTFQDKNGVQQFGFDVLDHTFIVGCVAKELMKMMPSWLKDAFIPSGCELIVACHDLGKISPTFYLKLATQVESLKDLNPEIVRDYFELVSKENVLWGGHATVSAVTLRECIKDKYIYKIVGSHHGALHSNINLFDYNGFDFGSDAWHEKRVEALNQLKNKLDCDFPQIKNETQAQILSGFTTVCDWIGSGGILSSPFDNWETNLPTYIRKTIHDAGFQKLDIRKNLSFNQLFGSNFQPNPLQESLHSTGIQHGLNIVEAPMGIGKTEAALYLAYKCLEQGQATGIYFALPTQVTSNLIYKRFNDFLSNVLVDSDSSNTQLLHGNSLLAKTAMGEEGDLGRSWFDANKRGLLAPFAVGTLDQALLSVMNVRHSFVRSYGLMGKVVILDEVHCYDAFTGLILDELVKHLLAIKCTVIILSATLTSKRKLSFIPENTDVSLNTYPQITTFDPNSQQVFSHNFNSEHQTKKQVQVSLKNRSGCFQKALHNLQSGQYVLWVENTVNEAIETFKDFKQHCAELNFDCGLLHSRFTAEDRLNIENEWVTRFGKSNQERYINGRGCILIGTQILEQSLDIDADYIVSNLAPIDLLLQRSGRLWRHQRENRVTNECCLDIISNNHQIEDEIDMVINRIGPSAYVYYPYILLKTLSTLKNLIESNSGVLTVPDAVPQLIEDTYADDNIQLESKFKCFKDAMFYGDKKHDGLNKLRQKARANISKFGLPVTNDHESMTRYSTMQTVQLLIVRDLQIDSSSKQLTMTFSDGSSIAVDLQNNPAKNKHLSLKLMAHYVKVNANKLSPNVISLNPPTLLKSLNCSQRNDVFVCKETSEGLIHWDGAELSNRYTFFYNNLLGLTEIKKAGKSL